MAVNLVENGSTTAADNTSVGGVSIAEGCPTQNLNNSQRAIIAGIKEITDATMGAKTTGGSADTQTLSSGLALTGYAAGQAFLFEAGYTNTGACTLNVDSLGAKAITDQGGNALVAGEITAGGMYWVAYEADGDDFTLLTPYSGAIYLANIVEDTTPQLGGNLDVNGKGIVFSGATVTDVTGADTKLVSGTAGTASDLAIWNGDGDLVDGPTPPSGTIVGTTDTQTLTGKTLSAADNTISNLTGSILFVIDGGGSTITTGVKGDIGPLPAGIVITQATLLADQSGSIVVDLWYDSYSNHPPTDSDSITASAPPTISTATKSQDSTLTGWTTSLAAGGSIRVNVDSVATVTRVTLALKYTRSGQ